MADQTDATGHVEAAEVLGTLQEKYDQATELAQAIPDGFRVVEVSAGEGYSVERETEVCPKWVPVAKFTEDDARYEWADELQTEMPEEYRCVVDSANGNVWLEVLVGDE